ncbi:MAG: HK97 gp10 family phage protein [Patescibacteria group bacterium]|nr:HK97 gp10 family phage protein [Patescibacteria group bacterium]
MFTDSIAIKGLTELEQKLKLIPIKLRKSAMRKALRAGGKIILAATKQQAPVASGLLESELKLRAYKNKKGFMSVRIGTGKKGNPGPAFYATFVELGYKHRGGHQVPANPFMKRASDSAKDEAGRAVVDTLQTQLAELSGGGA